MRLDGIPVFESRYAPTSTVRYIQYRFPRSKKQRIRNKWKNRARNWRPEILWHVFKMNGAGMKSGGAVVVNPMVVNPMVVDRLSLRGALCELVIKSKQNGEVI